MDLSVGQVSGLIATGVFVLQLLLPLAFPAVLVGFVGNTNPAVTWSVLGRFLHSSWWPTLLQTDTTASHGVPRRVSNVMRLQTATAVLVSVAAILTPLGLYQTVDLGRGPQLEPFQYVPDESAFGYGTPARLQAPFTRSCGQEVCPGSAKNETCVQQGLLQNCTGVVYDRAVPAAWLSTLRAGARRVAPSVASLFDMQWRTQVNASDGLGAAGWYVKSGYRQIAILVLDAAVQLVEGLIVDARDGDGGGGGIGFRNHTAPRPDHAYGSTWAEDVLFVTPATACVDTNLTFDFRLTQNGTSRLAPDQLALTDRGGFSRLSRTSPGLARPPDGNGQGPLDLRDRAYKAAWLNNFLTLAYFNATDPDPENIRRWDVTPGMAFRSNSSRGAAAGPDASNSTFAVEYQSLRSSLFFGEYLVLSGSPSLGSHAVAGGNPFGISSADFSLVSNLCAGGSAASRAHINSSLVGCGLVYGIARRTDGGSELSPEPGSAWSVPLYSCAASVEASVRTVTFRSNGTGLAGLQVADVAPKAYAPAQEPLLWAVEDMRDLRLADAQPLWGVLGDDDAAVDPAVAANLSTWRGASLRLPGVVDAYAPLTSTSGGDYVPSKAGQNLPGVDFFVLALQSAFSVARPGGAGYAGYGDYSGLTSLALYAKWRDLSATAAGAASIVNLVWTDVAANAVVGTRGWGLASGGDADEDDRVPVTAYRRRVRYRMPFAVPGLVVLALAVGVLGAWMVLLARGRTSRAKMRRLLDATSAGRLMGVLTRPDAAGSARRTGEWVRTVSARVLAVSEESIVEVREQADSGDGKHSKPPEIRPGVVTVVAEAEKHADTEEGKQ